MEAGSFLCPATSQCRLPESIVGAPLESCPFTPNHLPSSGESSTLQREGQPSSGRKNVMPTKDKLIVIRRFGTEIDAQVAKAYLDSKGIDSIIEKDDVGGLNPNFQMTSGVSLIVRQRDEKKAVKLLDSVRGYGLGRHVFL